jgi:hypothetical protein
LSLKGMSPFKIMQYYLAIITKESNLLAMKTVL